MNWAEYNIICKGMRADLDKMSVDEEYFNKFAITLKNALISGKVRFPDSLQQEYNDVSVYRGVKYTSQKKMIDKTDFLSYIEVHKNNPLFMVDDSNISSYSCSCFLDIEELHMQTKFPSKNKAIAKGIIRQEYGPIDINEKTSHVDWYLFDNIDPSDRFEVVEKWEKNG